MDSGQGTTMTATNHDGHMKVYDGHSNDGHKTMTVPKQLHDGHMEDYDVQIHCVSITFFHLPATLPSLPDYALPHLSLVQPHGPKKFQSFLNFALYYYQPPL